MEKRNEMCVRGDRGAEKRAGTPALSEDVDELVESAVMGMRRREDGKERA